MSSDENIEMMKRNMSPETLNKATQLHNKILDVVSYHNKYKVMTNAQLANELMLDVWAELPMWSEFSELLEVVIERLQGNEKLQQRNS